jgi:hypothetical protein
LIFFKAKLLHATKEFYDKSQGGGCGRSWFHGSNTCRAENIISMIIINFISDDHHSLGQIPVAILPRWKIDNLFT